jgi:CheY-like chemotaxis protein
LRDNGTGMSDEVRARAFEPFFTTKGPGEGTGLGLATVYGIIKQSNGSVELDSAPGKGTTVTLCLPCVDGAESLEGAPAGRRAHGGSERILLVEDNDVVRAVTASLLRSLGYDVVEAGTPADVERVDLGAVDLVVCDVLLPELNGRELVDRMLRRRGDLRALFISGYAPDGTVGPDDDFLQKPFSEEELGAAVRDVLDRR